MIELQNKTNSFFTFDDWVVGFYSPLIINTMKSLKEKGVFILNIGSRRYPLNKVLCEISSNNGFKIKKLENMMSGVSGLGKTGDGETFYEIRKGK